MTIAEERLRPNTQDDSELLFHWHRYQAIEQVTQGKSLLEIGFGDGYGAHYLSASAHSVIAVDIDADAVDEAKAHYVSPNLVYQEASGLSLPFPDHHFEVVIAFEVIEHLERQDQERFLREVQRVLRPGGLFALSTPDHHRTVELEANNPWHIGEVSAEELKHLLGQYFPHVDLYYQELSAASIMWNPDHLSEVGYGYAYSRTDGLSHPAPVALTSHLPLVTLASAQPITVNLSGFCTDTERSLLVKLWDKVGSLEYTLHEERAQHHQALNEQQRVIDDLREECMSLWRESRAMAEVIMGAHEVQSEYEKLIAERPALIEAQAQWEFVSHSKAWIRLTRYWHWLDHSTPGRLILWAKRRGRKV